MRPLFFTILFLLLLPISLIPRSAAAALWRPLAVGASGADVLELQQILNRDPATQVAVVGPGSLGQETLFFGPQTEQAVVRFQEKYAASVLWPVGLSRGTGYVGAQTLAQLKISAGVSPVALPAAPTVAIPPPPPLIPEAEQAETRQTSTSRSSASADQTSPSRVKDLAGTPAVKMSRLLRVSSLTPVRGQPGTKVTIRGRGFSLVSNDVFVGSAWRRGVKSPDGETLTVEVPDPFATYKDREEFSLADQFEIPIGIYVVNSSGASNGMIFTMRY